MENLYDVVFSGGLRQDVTLEDAVGKFVAISKVPKEKAEALLTSGRPVTLKKAVELRVGQSYLRKLGDIGLQMKLVENTQPLTPPSPPRILPIPSEPDSSLTSRVSPRPATDRRFSPQVPAPPANPYAAPRANLDADGPTSTGFFLREPRKLRAGRGWKWLTEAISLFWAEPWKWLGMYGVAILSSTLFSLIPIPILGHLVGTILYFVLAGGLVLGAHSLREGHGLQFSRLFSGFGRNRNQLMLLGVYYLLGVMGVFFLGGVVLFFVLGQEFVFQLGLAQENPNPEAIAAALQQYLPTILIIVLLGMSLTVPLIMSVWFAPNIIAITDTGAFTAMKISFKACLKNVLPSLVYGLGVLLLTFFLGIVLSVLSGIAIFFARENTLMITIFLPFIVLLFFGLPSLIIFGLSTYTGFRDIFSQTPKTIR